MQEGRDTIWAFILKNYYRPAYLRQRPFDLVSGNPPWLSYRYITDPGYQRQMKGLVFNYGLLSRKDVKLFTQMEEATLFFTLSADAYLKKGGTIAFVMPRSVLTGAKQHQRFQEMLQGFLLPILALDKVLDAEEVSPLFEVPACVLIAKKEAKAGEVTKYTLKGTLPKKNLSLLEAKRGLKLKRQRLTPSRLFPPPLIPSPYLKHIKEGATLVPRSLWFVQPVPSPYGINRERPALETSPEVENAAKTPWQGIHLQGEVEAQYVYATILSRQLLPFGFTRLSLVVIPLEPSPAGSRLMKKEAALGKGHWGLYGWLSQAEILWKERRKERSPVDIYSRIDYQRLLTCQHPSGYYTVVIGRPGTNVASCVIEPRGEVRLDEGLRAAGFVFYEDFFLYQTKDGDEAHYLCAFLNSIHVDQAIKPYQTRGAWGARHIQRRPFEVVPIPRFDGGDKAHQKLAELSQACHKKVAGLAHEGKAIGRLRAVVRETLKAELEEIDHLVKQVLSSFS